TSRFHWAPGLRHPQYAHIVSGKVEHDWDADPGYRFAVNGDIGSARWQLGQRNPRYPHASAGAEVDTWVAAPWCSFHDQPAAASATWAAGRRHASQSHITTKVTENRWVADPGYSFVRQDSYEVEWRPGVEHPAYPHVLASDKPDNWHAATG